jgi:hypothetical protein
LGDIFLEPDLISDNSSRQRALKRFNVLKPGRMTRIRHAVMLLMLMMMMMMMMIDSANYAD